MLNILFIKTGVWFLHFGTEAKSDDGPNNLKQLKSVRQKALMEHFILISWQLEKFIGGILKS